MIPRCQPAPGRYMPPTRVPAHLGFLFPVLAYLLGFAFDQWLAQVTHERVTKVERTIYRDVSHCMGKPKLYECIARPVR